MLLRLGVVHILTFMLVSDLWPVSFADVFSAMFKMEHLLETRQRVINDLDIYIHKEEDRLRDLKMYLKKYKAEHKRATKDMINYTGNPINAFILINRLTSDLDDIEKRINKPTEFVSVRNVTTDHKNATILYPTSVDLEGAALALKRLHRTYKLKVEDLANGVLNGVVYSNQRNVAIGLPMTASDCYKIGVILLTKKDYMNALAWQMEALRKFKLEDNIPHSFTEFDVIENIATLNHNLGDSDIAAEWTLKILELDPDNDRAQENIVKYNFANEAQYFEDDEKVKEPSNGDAINESDAKSETNKTDAGVEDKIEATAETVDKYEIDTKNEKSITEEDIKNNLNSLGTNETYKDTAEVDTKTDVGNDKYDSGKTTDSNPTINDNGETIDNGTTASKETSSDTNEAEERQTDVEYAIESVKDSLAYKALCRGEYQIAPEIASRVTCYYKNDTPFLKLAPIKTEQHYIEPDVWVFYDVISDAEIAKVKELATPYFKRATLGNLNNYSWVSEFRIGEVSWLSDDDSDVIERLSVRIGDFTGLNMEYAEGLQVSTYGVGGHFVPHYDHNPDLIKEMPTKSHRIATAMFYMSDVTQGGATVFPKLGLSVFPVKGAAVFWNNLLPSGEGDLNTKHAGCPVLEGSKWVSNKWIGQWGQEFIKPCNLEYQRGDVLHQRPAPVLKPESLVGMNIV